MIAALFDVDGTLYSAQFGRGLLKYASENGRKPMAWLYYASLIPYYFLQKVGLFAQEEFLQLVMVRLAWLLRGMDREKLDAALNWNIHSYLFPTRHPEIIDLLEAHHKRGHAVLLVSAQFKQSLVKIGEMLGASEVIGTGLEVLDGRATGRIVPPVMTGSAKVRLVKGYFENMGLQVDWQRSYAYSDSITDRELLEVAGNPVAVYPDEKLRSVALEKGWEIMDASDHEKELRSEEGGI